MSARDEQPIITIGQGRLKGRTDVDYRGGLYYSFLGIPYAKPPLGKLRFKVCKILPQLYFMWGISILLHSKQNKEQLKSFRDAQVQTVTA